MKIKTIRSPLLIYSILTIVGCTTADRVFLVTKTNVGLDIDNKPPTAEITISRKEIAIQPIYPVSYCDLKNQDQSKKPDCVLPDILEPKTENQELGLPLLAAFGLQGHFLNPHITGHFAGGEAAHNLAVEKTDNNGNDNPNSEICLQRPPIDSRNFLARFWESEEDYRKRQQNFYFATDTSYGLKVGWSGTSGPYPDTLKLGYNRKEYASPPIFFNKGCVNNSNGWSVKLPSFYASIDNSSGWGGKNGILENIKEVFNPWSAKLEHVQFFATGTAATEFSKREQVRQVAFQNMAPNAAALTTKEINEDSLAAIGEGIKDESKKQKILEKAIALSLVEEDVKIEDLLAALKKNIIENNYLTTSKLYLLKKAAQ
jgi:hypothetical protein